MCDTIVIFSISIYFFYVEELSALVKRHIQRLHQLSLRTSLLVIAAVLHLWSSILPFQLAGNHLYFAFLFSGLLIVAYNLYIQFTLCKTNVLNNFRPYVIVIDMFAFIL